MPQSDQAERYIFLWSRHVSCKYKCRNKSAKPTFNIIICAQLLTLTIPWHGIDDYEVVQKILNGEEIPRPEMSYALSDMTDDRWNQIKDCWSVNESDRPSAFTAMDLVQKQLEASKIDVSSWVVLSCRPSQGSDSTRMSLLAGYRKVITVHAWSRSKSLHLFLSVVGCNRR